MENLIKKRTHDLYYRIIKQFPEYEKLFVTACRLFPRLPGGLQSLGVFFDIVEQEIGKDINPFPLLETGFKLGRLMNEPHEKDAAEYVFDEKTEFAFIYQNSLLLDMTVDALLRDYYNKLYFGNFDKNRFEALRRKYYRFVAKFYPCEIRYDVSTAIASPTIKKTIGGPSFGSLMEIHDLSVNTPRKHIFYLKSDDRAVNVLCYQKDKGKYLLLDGAVICKTFDETAARCRKTVQRLLAGKKLSEIKSDPDHWQLLETIEVSSSSLAAALTKGTNITGTTAWVTRDGKTLKAVLKQEEVAAHRRSERKKARKTAKNLCGHK